VSSPSSYVGRQRISVASSGTTLSVALAGWPALKQDDVIIAVISDTGTLRQITSVTDGWSKIGQVAQNNGWVAPTAYARQIGNPASEPAFAVTFSNSLNYASRVELYAFRDVEAAVIDCASSNTWGTGASISLPEISTVTDQALCLLFGANEGPSPGKTLTAALTALEAMDSQAAAWRNLGTGAWSFVKSPAGATGQQGISQGTSGIGIAGLLIALRPAPPRGSVSEGATLGATGDAVQAEVGDASAAVSAGASADWAYADGAGEGTAPSSIHPGTAQDAVQSDAGGQTAPAAMGVSADAVQKEVASATAAVGFGVTSTERLDDLGGGGAPATLGATPDASYVPAGVVTYPGPDTWQVTLDGIGPDPVEVRITDNLGSTLVIHLNENGIVPEPDNAAAQLGASADAGYWTPGDASGPAHLGAQQDARQADAGGAAAAVTIGSQSDAQVLPPLTSRWLAKLMKIGQSWIGGPYRRIPLDQFGWGQDVAVATGVQQDSYFTAKDAVDSGPDAAVSVGAAQDAVWHIVEPAVIITVPPLTFGVVVEPFTYGIPVAPTPQPCFAADPLTNADEVAPIPYGIVVPATPMKE
jgi:hypothetical protein